MSQALYHFYGEAGQLLYVGITKDPPARFRAHGQDKEWWEEVRGISVDWFDTRREALDAEKRAIRVERPKYNIQHNGERPRHKAKKRAAELRWLCDECRKPIGGDSGTVHVDISRAEHYKAQVKALYARNTIPGSKMVSIKGSDFLDLDPEAKWRVHHDACLPTSEVSLAWYGVAVDQWATYRDVLHRIAHLHQKRWIDGTNLSEFIYSIPSRTVAA